MGDFDCPICGKECKTPQGLQGHKQFRHKVKSNPAAEPANPAAEPANPAAEPANPAAEHSELVQQLSQQTKALEQLEQRISQSTTPEQLNEVKALLHNQVKAVGVAVKRINERAAAKEHNNKKVLARAIKKLYDRQVALEQQLNPKPTEKGKFFPLPYDITQ